MNGHARRHAFDAFAERVGRKRYGPEFVDSLVQTMRIPAGYIDLDEQVWAWTRWRSWCNSSETARSSWHSDGWDLDQIDCALDLHWFQTGREVRDIEDASRQERAEARLLPEVRKRKSSVCRAFAKVEARGHVDLSRGRIYAAISPQFSPQVVEKLKLVADVSNYDLSDPNFVAWLQVADASNLLNDMKQAEKALAAVRKVARARYREFQASGSPAVAILIDVKERKSKDLLSSSSSSDTEVVKPPELTTTTAEPETPPRNEPETDPGPVIEATLQHHKLRLTRDEALEIVDACRDKLSDPTVTPEETARFVFCVDPIRPDGGVLSPRRFLKRAITNAITREELRFMRDAARPAPTAPEPDEDREMESNPCRKCGGVTVVYVSGKVSWCRCEAVKRALSSVPERQAVL